MRSAQRVLAAAALLTIAAGCGGPSGESGEPVQEQAAPARRSAPEPGNGVAAEEETVTPAANTAIGSADAANGPESAAERPGATIPERYHGRWDASRAACARATSEMRLVVGPSSLRFYESEGPVVSVRGADGDAVAVELRLTGEGETRTETRYLRLTPERQLAVEVDGEAALRVRCPGS